VIEIEGGRKCGKESGIEPRAEFCDGAGAGGAARWLPLGLREPHGRFPCKIYEMTQRGD